MQVQLFSKPKAGIIIDNTRDPDISDVWGVCSDLERYGPVAGFLSLGCLSS